MESLKEESPSKEARKSLREEAKEPSWPPYLTLTLSPLPRNFIIAVVGEIL